MLLNVHVNNLALIDDADVCFKDGLNILTGETGAGKSIIIGSINIALGARISKDIVRDKEKKAFVELRFLIKNNKTKEYFIKNQIDLNDDILSIKRLIYKGKSEIFINDKQVNLSLLMDVTTFLIDVYGQHDHQSLLKQSKHLEILDEYAKEETSLFLMDLKEKYKIYKNYLSQLKDFDIDEEQRLREISFLEFEIDEIEKAGIIEGEDILLEEKYKIINNSNIIVQALSKSLSCLNNEYNDSATSIINSISKELSFVSSYDEKLSEFYKTSLDIDEMCMSLNREMKRYIDSFALDPKEAFEIENRLNKLNTLKLKYGKTITEILKSKDEKSEKLNEYINYEENKNLLLSKIEAIKNEISNVCNKLTNARQKAAVLLENDITKVLKELNFLDVRFVIDFEENLEFNEKGKDNVCFMVSTNPGESVKELAKIASGGELSRIMLGIKSILAVKDDIETLIFDEIDTGISGITAGKVANQLEILSKTHQVICITHLAQIASKAKNHYLIKKEVINNKTTTNVVELKEEESINELARIIGGAEITHNIIKSAREMKLN